VRAVIAEDLALLRDGLIRLLAAHEVEVVAAVGDGPSVIGALLDHRPDVAVLDVRLPPTFPVTETSRRILVPLGLHDTLFPLTSRQAASTPPTCSARLSRGPPGGRSPPSMTWPGSTGALLDGRLLPPAQQRELLTAIPVDDTGELFAEHYRLGVHSVQLSCGTAWGHGGGILGFRTFAYTSPDGNRQAVIVYNDLKKSLAPPVGTGTPAFQRDVKNRILREGTTPNPAHRRARSPVLAAGSQVPTEPAPTELVPSRPSHLTWSKVVGREGFEPP
jgi:hypothetical protein